MNVYNYKKKFRVYSKQSFLHMHNEGNHNKYFQYTILNIDFHIIQYKLKILIFTLINETPANLHITSWNIF